MISFMECIRSSECTIFSFPAKADECVNFCDHPVEDVKILMNGGADDVYYDTYTGSLMPVYWRETTIPAVGV